MALSIYNNALGFAQEVGLDLREHGADTVEKLAIHRKFTKLPGSIGAPEEAAFWEVFSADVVYTNGHEIVVFNS